VHCRYSAISLSIPMKKGLLQPQLSVIQLHSERLTCPHRRETVLVVLEAVIAVLRVRCVDGVEFIAWQY
jgi:hypothetical protein